MNKVKALSNSPIKGHSIVPFKSKIKLICSNKIHIISKSEILFLKSDSNYCEVNLIDGRKIVCSQTLKLIEQKLHSSHFFRPHNSYVFNVKYLESVSASMNELALEGGVEIPISRSKKSQLRHQMDLWFD